MARIKPINEAWKDCPRADECCVGACPLVKGNFVSLSCDPQSKCTLGKTARLRIGKKWGLSNQGLFPRELASKKAWDNLPEKVKAERLAKLQKKSPIVKLSEKGYAIVPKKKVMPETHGQNEKTGLKTSCVSEIDKAKLNEVIGDGKD